jgi:signal transduction histidine kinase
MPDNSSIEVDFLSRVVNNKSLAKEPWFRRLFSASPDGLMALKAIKGRKESITDLEIIFANKKALELIGKESLDNKKFSQFFAGNPQIEWFDHMREVIQTGKEWGQQMNFTLAGKEIPFTVSISRLDEECCIICYYPGTGKAVSGWQEMKTGMENLEDGEPGIDVPPIGVSFYNVLRDGKKKVTDFELAAINDEARRLLPKDPIGKRFTELFADKLLDGMFERMVETAETGSPQTLKVYYNSQGVDNWLIINIIRFGEGIINSVQNIQRNELMPSDGTGKAFDHDSLFRSLAEIVPEMISVQSYPSRQVIYHNHEPNSLGFNVEDLALMPTAEREGLVHPEDKDGLQTYMDEIGKLSDDESITYEYRARAKSNEWIWLRARGKVFERNAEGKPLSIINIVQNVTNEKHRAEEVEKLNKWVNQIEDLTSAGCWEYDIASKHFTWTEGMYKLFEMDGEHPEVHPSIYLDYVVKEDRNLAKQLVDTIEKDFDTRDTSFRIAADGKIKTLRIKTAPIAGDGGEVKKVVGVDVDISKNEYPADEINQLNRSLLSVTRELTAANSDLRTFTSIAANDYNEMLKNLYLILEHIINGDPRNLSHSGRANLRRAQAAIQKMKLITDDIVGYSRLHQSGERENSVDLPAVIQSIIKEMQEKFDFLQVEVLCDEWKSGFEGYPSLIRLLFRQLLQAAIQSRQKNQPADVKITCRQFVQVNDPSIGEGTFHEVTVTDKGVGYSSAEKEKLFELFYAPITADKEKNSGIGLAISRKIMEIHGGAIRVESEPGKGATFHCYFPPPK